jgi:hypothetical protein
MGQQARLPIREESISAFRRAWLVESECDAEALARSRAWLGRGRYRLAGSSPSTAHHAGIKIWLFDPASAASRKVHTVTN